MNKKFLLCALLCMATIHVPLEAGKKGKVATKSRRDDETYTWAMQKQREIKALWDEKYTEDVHKQADLLIREITKKITGLHSLQDETWQVIHGLKADRNELQSALYLAIQREARESQLEHQLAELDINPKPVFKALPAEQFQHQGRLVSPRGYEEGDTSDDDDEQEALNTPRKNDHFGFTPPAVPLIAPALPGLKNHFFSSIKAIDDESDSDEDTVLKKSQRIAKEVANDDADWEDVEDEDDTNKKKAAALVTKTATQQGEDISPSTARKLVNAFIYFFKMGLCDPKVFNLPRLSLSAASSVALGMLDEMTFERGEDFSAAATFTANLYIGYTTLHQARRFVHWCLDQHPKATAAALTTAATMATLASHQYCGVDGTCNA